MSILSSFGNLAGALGGSLAGGAGSSLAPTSNGGFFGGLSDLTLSDKLKFVGALGTGIAGFASANARADLARENARVAMERSRFEAAREAKNARRRRGAAINKFGALGGGIDFNVLADQDAQNEQNQLLIAFNGRAQARASNLQADQLEQAGITSLLGGAAGAASAVLPRLLE